LYWDLAQCLERFAIPGTGSTHYTVKLVQGGIARDRIYFPNWAIFRIIQNCKKKKIENQLNTAWYIAPVYE
jgi:hypothetical protein